MRYANVRSLTSQGSPYGRLRRALDRGNLLAARSAAAELGTVALSDALELLLLIAKQEPAKYPRAALRWHGRYAHEYGDVEPAEAHAVLGLLFMLTGARYAAAARALAQLVHRHGFEQSAELLMCWAEEERRPLIADSRSAS